VGNGVDIDAAPIPEKGAQGVSVGRVPGELRSKFMGQHPTGGDLYNTIQSDNRELIGEARNGIQFVQVVGQEFLHLSRQVISPLVNRAPLRYGRILDMFAEAINAVYFILYEVAKKVTNLNPVPWNSEFPRHDSPLSKIIATLKIASLTSSALFRVRPYR
jgi:hypothetical protein